MPNWTLDSTDLVIWSICIGVCLAFIISHIYRRLVGPFVRTLIAYDHISKESAATLDELKMNKRLVRLILKDHSPVMGYVSVVGGRIPRITDGKKSRYDYESARFYINEDKKDKIKVAFAEPERLPALIIYLALTVGCAYGLTFLVPILVALIS